MPPEKLAYALARYSRSPDSIRESLEWVRTHDSEKFLESFYFQYGHASIADLGHLALCFEGVSELAAIEVEDEQLWDGQARSSRYQDFSRSGFVTPPELDETQAPWYCAAAEQLLAAYHQVHARAFDFLSGKLPRPDAMKPDAYKRNVTARAFDIARYLLFLGVPTGVGQVTSIRTLEKQIRRLKASAYGEVRELGEEAASACAVAPECRWSDADGMDAIAPTLARHVEPDAYPARARADLRLWAEQNLPCRTAADCDAVDLLRPADTLTDVAATLLYPVTTRSFRELYDLTSGWGRARRLEVIDVAVKSRTQRDELLREFRGGLYAYDIVMDIGAYRDLHRHRRCQQYRQDFTWRLGWDTPAAVEAAGMGELYTEAITAAIEAVQALPEPASHYLLPFATKSRFLFKMDFAEAEYIARVRSGIKGHFSYREIAWRMKQKMEALEPELGRLMEATPPWIEDPLVR
jgi:thymidylate synthase ThyX